MAKLSQREIEICQRLRVFRESTNIARSKFALAIGVSSDRLASYEFARAPVRYDVFKAVQARFNVNPVWLATGKTQPIYEGVFDDSGVSSLIKTRSLFSDVFDKHLFDKLAPELLSRSHVLTKTISELTALIANKEQMATFRMADPVGYRKFFEQVDLFTSGIKKSVDTQGTLNRAVKRALKKR